MVTVLLILKNWESERSWVECLLVPGGAQGGDVKSVLEVGLDQKAQGLIISSSRILYAHEKSDSDRQLDSEKLIEAGIVARHTRDIINNFR